MPDPDPALLELVSAHYGREVTEILVKLDHQCEQLVDGNVCQRYETRPQACRDYHCNGEVGNKLVLWIDDNV
jgi:Fe-S-cluster containining protein